ncbi:MAG: hypothetical protein J2P21_00745 [Chloracidobacterium sp.]|nr:hypothetical protein [Chloracidobacterium sp.]
MKRFTPVLAALLLAHFCFRLFGRRSTAILRRHLATAGLSRRDTMRAFIFKPLM